jgi:hypothetical protein
VFRLPANVERLADVFQQLAAPGATGKVLVHARTDGEVQEPFQVIAGEIFKF